MRIDGCEMAYEKRRTQKSYDEACLPSIVRLSAREIESRRHNKYSSAGHLIVNPGS